MTDVTVHYERKFSDGNYGSEGLSMSWTVNYEDDNDFACDQTVVDARCRLIASALREAVLSQLVQSEARNVAHAAQRELNPALPREPVAAGYPTDPGDMPF